MPEKITSSLRALTRVFEFSDPHTEIMILKVKESNSKYHVH